MNHFVTGDQLKKKLDSDSNKNFQNLRRNVLNKSESLMTHEKTQIN